MVLCDAFILAGPVRPDQPRQNDHLSFLCLKIVKSEIHITLKSGGYISDLLGQILPVSSKAPTKSSKFGFLNFFLIEFKAV